MIAVLFAALQVAAAAAQSLVVHDATHSVRIPLIATATGPMLRAEALNPLLPVSVHHDSVDAYTLAVGIGGTRIELRMGTAIVRSDDHVFRLASAPAIASGDLLVPLQLISEVFPSVVPNTRWDADNAQLVLFDANRATPTQARPTQARPTRAQLTERRPTAGAADGAPADAAAPVQRTVVVDAGHGGVDNGMSGPIGRGPRIHEKDITLAVAKKLGAQLEARGVNVVYTRTTDTLIALDDRGRIANRAGGDLFISVHVNAANPNWKNPGASRGFETYFLSEARTEDARRVEQMENESVQFEHGPASDVADPLSFIKADMAQNEHLRESSDLAAIIQKSLARMHPGPSRGVKQAGFRVLVTAYMPSVLVEIGFGTNPAEAAYMSNSHDQDAIAAAVADGAMEYLRRYEGRVNPAGRADGIAGSGSGSGSGGGSGSGERGVPHR